MFDSSNFQNLRIY